MAKAKMAAGPKGFTAITIIYNPVSTGDGHKNALAFKRQLKTIVDPKVVTIVPTKYAGHAEEIAYACAMASRRPLIVASSGDGGYHEVVNGALRAQAEGAQIVTSLLPSGNANDHWHALHSDDTFAAIKEGHSRRIDVLKMTTQNGRQTNSSFAHSYIGLGVTPLVGAELNKTTLGPIKELWIVARTLLHAPSVTIEIDGKRTKYTNLIFSNILKMAKVLTLAEDASITDGKFEVNFYNGTSRFGLYGHLVKAAASSLDSQTHVSEYHFRTIKRIRLQLDGEIVSLPTNTDVKITCEKQLLHCIV
jgi:diacylglycerol kinase (ATP)